MKWLFLRGQVPQDRNPQEIVFETLEECDDVWTHLAYSLLHSEDQGELWYWGGSRKKEFKSNFTEKWLEGFKNFSDPFVPDIIFCRGGFKQYKYILDKFPQTFKIYYGAGKRFLPDRKDYDLILQDSEQQLEKSRNSFPSSRSELFIKPTVDHLFQTKQEVEKTFDICFPANGKQEHMKGHDFVFRTCPKDLKILNLGNSGKIKPPKNVSRKRVIRSEIGTEYQKCKMGIVCCKGEFDSCPRVIPEMLASGLPLVVFDETRFWKEKYITNETGVISSKDKFWETVKNVLYNLDKFDSRTYYEKNLSMGIAAKHIRGIVDEELLKRR